jgi:hypothetical protein
MRGSTVSTYRTAFDEHILLRLKASCLHPLKCTKSKCFYLVQVESDDALGLAKSSKTKT